MDIYMIWARSDGFVWLVESWDDDSISDNANGWEDAKTKAAKAHDEIRIIKATVDFDKVLAAFNAPETTLAIEEKSN